MANKKTPDAYFKNADTWREELLALRKILVSTGLKEELKWGSPFYTPLPDEAVPYGGLGEGFFGAAREEASPLCSFLRTIPYSVLLVKFVIQKDKVISVSINSPILIYF